MEYSCTKKAYRAVVDFENSMGYRKGASGYPNIKATVMPFLCLDYLFSLKNDSCNLPILRLADNLFCFAVFPFNNPIKQNDLISLVE